MATFQSTTGAPAEIRKPKIYISCRTPLQEADRNSIIEAVLACRNCDIFWFEDAVSNQERRKLLADMQLILLPVDLAVLTEHQEAVDADVAFALENHIPLLSVLMDPDLINIYKLPHKFGELPYILFRQEYDHFMPFADAMSLALNSFLLPETVLTEATGNLKALPAGIRKDFLRGVAIFFGFGQEKNATKGLKLLHKAALAGVAEADPLLLRIYTHGIGVPVNRPMALQFAARLLNGLQAQESLLLPEQLPDHLIDIIHLCSCVERADLSIRLISRLLKELDRAIDTTHPLTRRYRNLLLAYCKAYRDDRDWLLRLCSEQHDSYCQEFGDIHPYTLKWLYAKGYYTLKSGELYDGLELFQDAYEAVRQAHGEKSPITIEALCQLAHGCNIAQKYKQAKELSWLAYDLSTKINGRHHPTTHFATHVLSVSLANLGENRAQLRYARQLHASCRIQPGNLHPLTINAYSELAMCLSRNRQRSRAISYMEEVCRLTQQLYGAEHPETESKKTLLDYLKKLSDDEST